MSASASLVTTGKPKVVGGIYTAPKGTTLPSDATSAIDTTKYTNAGYIAEGGVTNSNSMDTTAYRAWGGDIVHVVQSGKDDTFAFGYIETLNTDVLKNVYGSANVSGTLATGITVQANAKEPDELVYVMDMICRDGALHRIVIPDGKVTAVGDIVYSDSEITQYPMTITAIADTSGNTHYEYFHEKTST